MSKHQKNEKNNGNKNDNKQGDNKPKGHSAPSREIPVADLMIGDRVPLGQGDTTATIVNVRRVEEQIIIPAYAHIITYCLDNGQAKGAYSYIVLGDYAKTRVCLTPEEKRVETIKSWVSKLKFWK
jgi:hypothetical protein